MATVCCHRQWRSCFSCDIIVSDYRWCPEIDYLLHMPSVKLPPQFLQCVYDKFYMFVHKLQSNLFNISAVFYESEILDLRFRNDMTVELVSWTEHWKQTLFCHSQESQWQLEYSCLYELNGIHIRTKELATSSSSSTEQSECRYSITVQLAMFLEEGNNIVEHIIATDCAE